MEQEFLQSDEWKQFQEAAGHRAVLFESESLLGYGITHSLPVAGEYVYFPRGPVFITNSQQPTTNNAQKFIEKVEEGIGWVRIEPGSEEELQVWQETFGEMMVKAPHDMQPREVFRIDISSSEEDLLVGMKPKTRYNIRLAEKRGVKVFETREAKYQEVFLDLISATASRKEITPHPKSYYSLFFSALPPEFCRLFIAEYEGKVLAANLMIFFGDTATYLHGGSSAEHRDVMAPYLLQWEQIRYAKSQGFKYYDFGGIKTSAEAGSWAGITRFKRGFSVLTEPFLFPGTYDIVLDSKRYFVYNLLRRLKESLLFFRKLFSSP